MNGQIVLCKGVNDGEELERQHPGSDRTIMPVSGECLRGSGGTDQVPGGTVSPGAFYERGCLRGH